MTTPSETGEVAPKPTDAKKGGLRLRSVKIKRDLMDRIVASINASKPKNKDGGTFEVVRTNKRILSSVRYVLRMKLRPWDEITGSFAFGRISEVYGLDSSGKTAMIIRAIVMNQLGEIYEIIKKDGQPDEYVKIPEDSDISVLFIDNEQSLDDNDTIVIDGVRIDGVLGRCDTIDQMFKMIENTVDNVHEYELETKRKQFVLVVVDTVSGTSSKEEIKQEWGEEDYPRSPKKLRQGFRIMMRNINRFNVCGIFTNQVGDSFAKSKSKGLPRDDDFSTSGGRALKFYASLRVFMFSHPKKYKLRPTNQFPDGLLIGFFTAKNRRIKPLREGRLVLLFSGGYSEEYSILETLIYLKLVKENWEKGYVSFPFKSHGIPYVGEVPASLEAQEEAESSRLKKDKDTDPRIICKAEWPAFYEKQKTAVDALWAVARQILFSEDFVPTVTADEIDDMDDDEEL